MTIRYIILICIITMIPAMIFAQTPDQIFQAVGTPANPKVTISFNRYYTAEGLGALAQQLADAHPDLITLQSIGKSYEGRDIWCLTVTDQSTGPDLEKPGFYIDGNIHSNEIQGGEFGIYTAWYLAESFGQNTFITDLLKEKVFYIVPTINPDARNAYMRDPNTANTPRSGMIPVDDDRDGLYDEDGYEDLNGDGEVTQMRRKTPYGNYIIDPMHPNRMIRVEGDQRGTHEIIGSEGIDNDGDGRVNEDRVGGYYDPNRNWGWNWQPEYIQRGSHHYPFSIPENRAVMEFALAHPNIAGAQSYHNTGGMLLRGPGAKEDLSTYSRRDIQVYDQLGKLGEQLIPGYRYLTIYKDLYSVFGGELDWFHGGRGVFTFTNELYTSYMMFNSNDRSSEQTNLFEDRLLFNDQFLPWEEFDHPTYGKIEIGGNRKNYRRNNPGFLLESDAHRNMAFTIYHAYQTPKLVVEQVVKKDVGGGYMEVTATIGNQRIIPTHSDHDLKYKISPPDFITLQGGEVVAGMQLLNKDTGEAIEQEFQPARLSISNISGLGTVDVRWLVKVDENSSLQILVESAKGGKVTHEIK
ncbi:MAG: peptidase M14 [Saprospiraceae bacterium]|nr:peptidase M14 [Saprospiraceae bacterium]